MRKMSTKPVIEWQIEGQMTIFDFLDESKEKAENPLCGHPECEAYPEGCGGTVEQCRFGGPYKWQKQDLEILRVANFETMTEQAAVSIIEEKTKLKFSYSEKINHYIAKKKGYMISICGFDHYFKEVRGGRRFLGVDISKKTWGSSIPAESIDEAVEFIERELEKG